MAIMDLRVTNGRGIHWLTGNLSLKRRIQHPTIKEETNVREPYWFIRVFEPVVRRGGAVDEVRKKYILGPSRGDSALGVKEAQLQADKILARVNGLMQPPEKKGQTPLGDFILFERLVEMFREGHMPTLGWGTQVRYNKAINSHLLPRFSGERLDAITHHEVQVWINGLRLAWSTKQGIKGILSGLFEYANRNDLYKARNPCSRVNCGRKRSVYSSAIPTPDQMRRILDLVRPARHRLILETALSNGLRVSEALALRWRQINWTTGIVMLEERLYRGNLDVLKTESAERKITLAGLLDQFRALYEKNGRPPGDAFVFDHGHGEPPNDQTVRLALKNAAAKVGVDALGFGMHALRRANITWRQGAGGASSIEASRMAGHSKVHITAKYTQVEDRRLQETTAAVRALWAAPAAGEGGE